MIKIVNLSKKFKKNVIFDNFNLEIKAGEMVAVTGESGCGKTTLLHIIGLLEEKTGGELIINNVKNPKSNTKSGRKLLKNDIGFIFQNFALVDNYSVIENFTVTDSERGNNVKEYLSALDRVGLGELNMHRKVCTLSGGEQQRIAIAKLIYKNPNIILADEPTGSLDIKNRDKVISILKELKKLGKTILIVTHDEFIAKECDWEVKL
ncbi:MAG: ATP-binding cassette domain-containing protein [Bacilli bacterium]